MKNIVIVFVAVSFSCATATSAQLKYLPVEDINFSSSVGIINIEEFEKIALESKSKIIYYSDDYFFIITDGMIYSHITRGYKTIREYKEGKLKTPEEWSIFKPGWSN
ncbi:MAG: hypothetical protein Ta2B_12530 [Termitinemataceae bacterium]|nr:MAG: hypothetical protein Ta2B_12530 [Termitinemataceae bacterium]